MVISTSNLSYFIDISHIQIEDMCEKLNSIGIEVESMRQIQIPQKVVVGRVVSKNPHPNADKLNICQVDVGNQTFQIVCGAQNVQKDQYVALALEGAELPVQNNKQDNKTQEQKTQDKKTKDKKDSPLAHTLTIKKTTLRGVESCGMICSSSELGLEKINDGIMVLDSSIGELELGKPLCEYEFFNQYLIEVSLTPNRGDCLCILGIARELACVYNLSITLPSEEEYGLVFGIGRALNLSVEGCLKSYLLYKAIEVQEISMALHIQLILAYNGILKSNPIQNYKNFITYLSGVLFNIYPISNDTQTPITLKIKKDENELESVYDSAGHKLSEIGIKSYVDESKIVAFPALLIVEASYAEPEIISKALFHKHIPHDKDITYRSTRGSNPELLIGMNLFCSILNTYTQCSIYSGYQEVEMTQESQRHYVNMTFNMISQIIGKEVEKEKIALILKQLNFKIDADGDGVFFRITPPPYRHDIYSPQDVAEEFLRIYGIKNIPSTPYSSIQKRGINKTLLAYQNKRDLATRAIAQGFFETIHYVFYQRSKLVEWGFEVLEEELDLKNPITNELNTLRTSLIPGLFDSVVRNQNFGYKSIKMFEIGSVYNRKREESQHMSFVVSGFKTQESYPYPKGEKWDFYSFAQTISHIIGDFELSAPKEIPTFAHPYQYADIILGSVRIGFIGRLHPKFAQTLDIQGAFFAQIDTFNFKILQSMKPYSKLHSNQRDLTIVIDKDIPFHQIKSRILDSAPLYLKAIYPLDVYEDKDFALTLRAVFQPQDISLTEEQIAGFMEQILHILESEFNAKLKI